MNDFQKKAEIIRVETLTPEVFRFTVHSPAIAAAARPGQFVMVRVEQGNDPLLPRPFSVHNTESATTFQLLFKIVGRGTSILADLEVGDRIRVFGPLGRGFTVSDDGPVCFVAGGMGGAPLFFLAKYLRLNGRRPDRDIVLLGARDQSEVKPIADDFIRLGYRVETATDDGSMGHHGLVTDLFDGIGPGIVRVYSCGPYPMMGVVAEKCRQKNITCEVSVETIMACGVGACLGCTILKSDGSYAQVCKDGPVFTTDKLAWTV